ncbi:MAG: acetolactate decarboxylase [Cyclobacteriaceae bacterium]|nr:acetolactate decarboxylase [Cyclobacteriaceae bacterium]
MKNGLRYWRSFEMYGFSIQYLLILLLVVGCTKTPQRESKVHVTGAMRNVMWKGELQGAIDLDSLQHKENLYGLGPVEFLAGEILILDGKSFVSRVLTDSTISVAETFQVKAPFFVHAQVRTWESVSLPDSVTGLRSLEKFIDTVMTNQKRPFAFRLTGKINKATIHVVNLPPGSTVSSPDEAHQGQVNYKLVGDEVEILGFFSRRHKGIFTHHDTNMHLHLITRDNSMMGHVDKLEFDRGAMKLWFSSQ